MSRRSSYTFDYNEATNIIDTTPLPTRTETYSPIAHGEILSYIGDKIVNDHLDLYKIKLNVALDGSKMVASYILKTHGAGMRESDELMMMLAARNSYDKSMSFSVAIGATVFVCLNGMISGDIAVFKRKHTGDIRHEVIRYINESFDNMYAEFAKLNLQKDLMKSIELTEKDKMYILGELFFNKNILSVTEASKVKKEIANPEVFRDNTLWSLYNNVTSVLGNSHPMLQHNKLAQLHNFVESNFLRPKEQYANSETVTTEV